MCVRVYKSTEMDECSRGVCEGGNEWRSRQEGALCACSGARRYGCRSCTGNVRQKCGSARAAAWHVLCVCGVQCGACVAGGGTRVCVRVRVRARKRRACERACVVCACEAARRATASCLFPLFCPVSSTSSVSLSAQSRLGVVRCRGQVWGMGWEGGRGHLQALKPEANVCSVCVCSARCMWQPKRCGRCVVGQAQRAAQCSAVQNRIKVCAQPRVAARAAARRQAGATANNGRHVFDRLGQEACMRRCWGRQPMPCHGVCHR